MKNLQNETNFAAAHSEENKQTNDGTVSFAPAGENVPQASDTAISVTAQTLSPDFADEVEAEAISFLQELFGDHELIDTEEADNELADEKGWLEADDEPVLVYDVPRPALTIDEAASILGKSVRAVERSISGKWGNRLPEGWKARRMRIDGQNEWRIIPPPSFRIRHSNKVRTNVQTIASTAVGTALTHQPGPDKLAGRAGKEAASDAQKPAQEEGAKVKDLAESLFGFSLNSLIQTAGRKAKTELVKAAEYALDNGVMEHPTIVIDRSDEVERLLRQLSEVQKELSEERRLHLEDMRLLAEMQSSFRLLEMKSSQTNILKEELTAATQALAEHKRQYQEFLALPWWKRLFRKAP